MLLFSPQNLQHHYRSLGGWSFAFRDYFYENVTQYVDDPNMLKMEEIIDPYSRWFLMIAVDFSMIVFCMTICASSLEVIAAGTVVGHSIQLCIPFYQLFFIL